MEIDGGSSVSLISDRDRRRYFPELKVEETPVTLTISYYSGERCKPKGILRGIRINYGRITVQADLYVVGEKGPLIGRDWLHALALWPFEIKQRNTDNKVLEIDIGKKRSEISMEEEAVLYEKRKEIFKEYKQLFSSGLGTYNKSKFKIRMQPNTMPVYHKARSIPFALKGKVEAEINRLVKENILSLVEVSEWGTPIVPINNQTGRGSTFMRRLQSHGQSQNNCR